MPRGTAPPSDTLLAPAMGGESASLMISDALNVVEFDVLREAINSQLARISECIHKDPGRAKSLARIELELLALRRNPWFETSTERQAYRDKIHEFARRIDVLVEHPVG